MVTTLSTFSYDLKDWNKSVYSHITFQKKIVVKVLTRIQKIMDLSGSNRLA